MEKRGKEALIDVGFLSPQLFLPSVFSQDRKSDTKMFLLPHNCFALMSRVDVKGVASSTTNELEFTRTIGAESFA